MLDVEYDRKAVRKLRKIPTEQAERILMKIESLRMIPFPADAVRVIHQPEMIFRIRVGDMRVQYRVFRQTLFITSIEKRSKAYQF
ncbi:hypothetical protein J4464_03905 [Candidatus Woesearchaeota archaeon]|nr:hypothetical protein [Candidatus Woesearchaeota archaeon]